MSILCLRNLDLLAGLNEDYFQALDREILQWMMPVEDLTGHKTWQCLKCDKNGSKIDTMRHVETNHIEHGGFTCPLCGIFSKNRNSLRKHISVKHRKNLL